MTWPKLSQAPIVEAIVDFRFAQPVGLQKVRAFCDSEAQSFPSSTELWHHETIANLAAESTQATGQRTLLGYRLDSADKLTVVQARSNGFTVSHLAPYRSWLEFQSFARDLWHRFVSVAGEPNVPRIAHRAINRLDIPLPFDDLSQYVTLGPQIPPKLPQALVGCLMRVEIPLGDIPALAIVGHKWERPEGPPENKSLPVILDLDVVHLADRQLADEQLWGVFDKLHDARNRLFFNSITPEMLERLK